MNEMDEQMLETMIDVPEADMPLFFSAFSVFHDAVLDDANKGFIKLPEGEVERAALVRDLALDKMASSPAFRSTFKLSPERFEQVPSEEELNASLGAEWG